VRPSFNEPRKPHKKAQQAVSDAHARGEFGLPIPDGVQFDARSRIPIAKLGDQTALLSLRGLLT
jgi:hypothetical protein